eukprot:5474595-Pleurochrysis_carterae.AAC.1
MSSQLIAGSGPGGKALPVAMRVLVRSASFRGIGRRGGAVGPNIAAVLRLVVSWHPCIEVESYDLVCKLRKNTTIVGEMLAARQVAELKPIISFGFDETSKFQ